MKFLLLFVFLRAAAARDLEEPMESKTCESSSQLAAQDVAEVVGRPTCEAHNQPWRVSLNTDYQVCGGTIISTLWVVTSAQCHKKNIEVILGKHNISEQLINSDKVIRHGSFNSKTLANDIMLIKLASPVTLNADIQNVSLPSSCAAAGTVCESSGWSNTPSNGFSMPNTSQCVIAPIMDSTKCSSAYPGEITDNMICADSSERGKDVCQGDSGSPLVCNGELQGIASRGFGCGQKKDPIAYTKVCNYVDWIYRIMAEN